MEVTNNGVTRNRPQASTPLLRDRQDRVARLYHSYRRFARRVLLQNGVDANWMDDALQDVFVVVIASYDQRVRKSVVFVSWIAGVCRNVAHAYRRRRARLVCYDERPETEDDLPTPEEACALQQAKVLLEGFLTELDPKKRALFELAELYEVSGAVAADCLGINVHTAYARLRVARASFERRVQTLQLRDARMAS